MRHSGVRLGKGSDTDVTSAAPPDIRAEGHGPDGRGDGQLMAAVGRGDAAAFRVIVEAHSGALYRLAFRFTGRASEAEDVVQDVLVKVWTNPGAWKPGPGGGLAAWLRRVTTNRCLDGLRRRAHLSDAEVPERADPSASAEEGLNARRLAQHAVDAIAALPDRQRAAIILTYYEELPNAAAADALGMGVDAFESLLVRARKALRLIVEKSGLTVDDLRGGA